MLGSAPAGWLSVFGLDRDPSDAPCCFNGLNAGAARRCGRKNPHSAVWGRLCKPETPHEGATTVYDKCHSAYYNRP